MEPGARSPDPAERAEFFARLQALAVSSGATVTFGIIPSTEEGGEWRSMLAALDATEQAGGRMFGQSHSRGVNSVLSFRTALPFDRLPEWAEVRTRSLDEQRKMLGDPACRKRLVDAANHGDYGRSIGAEARPPSYEVMRVMEDGYTDGPTVAELAARRGVDPVDLIIELGLRSGFDQLFIQPLGVVDDAGRLEIMRHRRTAMTFSDSGAHVSQIIDASIQTHLLAHWVRDRQEMTLEEAIRLITSVPATVWGFSDRGRLPTSTSLTLSASPRPCPKCWLTFLAVPSGSSRSLKGSWPPW
jgi:N-acyl-D-aspartate/D-glutamate deacylase